MTKEKVLTAFSDVYADKIAGVSHELPQGMRHRVVTYAPNIQHDLLDAFPTMRSHTCFLTTDRTDVADEIVVAVVAILLLSVKRIIVQHLYLALFETLVQLLLNR